MTPRRTQRMQAAGVRAIDACTNAITSADRVAREIEALEPTSTGVPITLADDNDSLVLALKETQAVKEDVDTKIAIARTRSKDLAP